VWSWGRGNKKRLEKENKENNRKLNDDEVIKLFIIDIP